MKGKIVFLTLLAFLVPLLAGCSSPPPCTVSPIEIEETREDTKTLDKSLAEAREKAKQLETKLREKRKEYNQKKDKPAELRKKVDELKKGSGRDKDKKE